MKIPDGGMPLRSDKALSVTDLRDVVDEITEMLDNKRYAFASEVLNGILAHVTERGTLSLQQRRAIENIRQSVEPSGPRTGSRRYEGYTRSE